MKVHIKSVCVKSAKLQNTQIFRHGDRTFDAYSDYPNNPYANETYYPFGLGELTSKGKIRMYKVGSTLRARYQKLLEPVYKSGAVYARATDTDRTKNSLQLVLASLYPPKNTVLEWNHDLNWNPIPIQYAEADKDDLLTLASNTEKYQELLQNYIETSPKGQEITKMYQPLLKIYTDNTGKKVDSLGDVFLIWTGLQCQKEWGLKLPDWATNDVMEASKTASGLYLSFFGATAELRRLSGGPILQKMVNDSMLKMTNHLIPSHRKIFLYSAHDSTVAMFLSALNLFDSHVVSYGAFVILELHKINHEHGFKIFYQNYESKNPKLLRLSGCNDFCPYDKFVSLLSENFPSPPPTWNKTVAASYHEKKYLYDTEYNLH